MLLIPRQRYSAAMEKRFVNLFSDSDPRWESLEEERKNLYKKNVLLTPLNNLTDLDKKGIEELQNATSLTLSNMSPMCFYDFQAGKVELWRTYYKETPDAKPVVLGMIPIPSRATIANTVKRFVEDWKRTCGTQLITWQCTRAHTTRPIEPADTSCECCTKLTNRIGEESYGVDVLCGENTSEPPEIIATCKLSPVAEYFENQPLYVEVNFPQKTNQPTLYFMIAAKDSTVRSCRKLREAYNNYTP